MLQSRIPSTSCSTFPCPNEKWCLETCGAMKCFCGDQCHKYYPNIYICTIMNNWYFWCYTKISTKFFMFIFLFFIYFLFQGFPSEPSFARPARALSTPRRYVMGISGLEWYQVHPGTISGWWFGTMEFYDFPSWEESSPLTNSYVAEGWLNHQPDIVSHRNWMYIPLEPLNRHFGHVWAFHVFKHLAVDMLWPSAQDASRCTHGQQGMPRKDTPFTVAKWWHALPMLTWGKLATESTWINMNQHESIWIGEWLALKYRASTSGISSWQYIPPAHQPWGKEGKNWIPHEPPRNCSSKTSSWVATIESSSTNGYTIHGHAYTHTHTSTYIIIYIYTHIYISVCVCVYLTLRKWGSWFQLPSKSGIRACSVAQHWTDPG